MNTSILRIASALLFGAAALGGCGGGQDVAEQVAIERSPLVSASATYDGIFNIGLFQINNLTQCTVGGVTMHCCPQGKAMVGAHVDRNVFKCANLDPPNNLPRFLDSGTVSTVEGVTLHSCPLGAVMVGFHRDLNLLACQWLTSTFTQHIDSGTADGFPMHVCGTTPAGGFPCTTNCSGAMAGIHVDLNKFLCDYPVN